MGNWSIRAKLGATFGSLTLIVLIIAGLALNALSNANDYFSSYISGISARANTAQAIQAAVARRALASRDMLLVSPSERAHVAQAGDDAQRDVAADVDKLNMLAKAARVPADVQTLVDNITRIEASYSPVAADIIRFGLSGDRDAAIAKIDHEGRPLLKSLQDATKAYMTLTLEREHLMVQASQDSYVWHRNVLIAICLAAALGAVAAGVLITRSLTRQLGAEPSALKQIARRVALGDLMSVDRNSSAMQGSVLASMEDMQRSLITPISQVRAAATGIAAGSGEIAQGNLDLSSRTEQQAASLQETSASMEQLTATVHQNASNAQQASEMATKASDVAARSTSVARDVALTMSDIRDSSRKIEEITGIIEGIAFQTNILALNAAVEAARAGEEGRGFAVVANEVRSLAQRSASASKEIKALIAASAKKVADGSMLADQSGKTMDQVALAISEVTALISEIASASDEQSRGIAQVNLAVTEMDEVTQQNAALVEEASAASQALESQGRRLIEAVASFKVAA